jgi:hypothetical protein
VYQSEIGKQEGNSSELEAGADAFWNVLERQLLVSANAP